MPIYSFRDTATGEIFDIMMSMSDLDEYKIQHPQHERYFDAGSVPALVSGVSLTGKLDDGFKDVLSRISEAHPNSELADGNIKKTIKQAQTDRVVQKWKSAH